MSTAPFFGGCPTSTRMSAHYGTVNDQTLHIGVFDEVAVHPLPYTFLRPAHESLVYAAPLAILGRQQSPLGTTASHPKDRFDEATTLELLTNVDIWAISETLLDLCPLIGWKLY